ncbi:PHD finger protein At3g20280-like [Zingiber officinale]|uniref:PHD finger protein At3g20280-like n=1 Tax=Zingiber officinale TaxID=94328 RepID=UPI001C4B15FE|nr:PHD finger protein At3g20280-like [Zingiber officinale]
MPTSSRGFHNSSTISHVPVLAWVAPNLKQSLISDAQAGVNTIKHSSSFRDKALPSAHNGLNARPSGSSYLTQDQVWPGILEIKSFTVQAGQGGLHITHQPTQGFAFLHAPSLYTNHNEIGKSVQRILQSKVLDHPNWIPPSSDYMNASLNCQICKNVISDIESLLVCDACEKGNHLKCLQSYGSKDIPKAEWHCPSCLASSNGKTLPPKYGRVTRAPVPAPRAAPNTSINAASKKTEDLDPNTSRRKALANNNSYVSQHSNSSNLGGSHYDSMVIGAEMDSRTNVVKRDNEKCDAVGDHLEETNGSVCANSDASCGYPNDIENDSGFNSSSETACRVEMNSFCSI